MKNEREKIRARDGFKLKDKGTRDVKLPERRFEINDIKIRPVGPRRFCQVRFIFQYSPGISLFVIIPATKRNADERYRDREGGREAGGETFVRKPGSGVTKNRTDGRGSRVYDGTFKHRCEFSDAIDFSGSVRRSQKYVGFFVPGSGKAVSTGGFHGILRAIGLPRSPGAELIIIVNACAP